MTEGLMNKVEKKLDVLCLGAAVVDIPLRPVSREVFDIESYPVTHVYDYKDVQQAFMDAIDPEKKTDMVKGVIKVAE